LAERSGFTQARWLQIITRRLAHITKRPVVIRDKPKINRDPAPLREAMNGGYVLITYSSNAAIEATMAGYPVICTGPNPCDVFVNNFEMLARGKLYVADEASRTAWAAMLCANQWTLAEIAAGKAWEALTK
jgi:hypothetical protein